MISRVLALSIQHRWLVVLLSLGAVALGLWSLVRLPIDAVPDITNKQVQINTTASALSPVEIEKQVTFRIETALAGIPGLDNTRSISRNGFSQVTAVFTEKTDIYFARQQVSERLLELRPNLPPGVEPKMGPISTGLGEIYMWSVAFAPAAPDAGPYVTPEGERLNTEVERAAYLRTVQDWIIRPQIKSVTGVAGVDSIGGYVKQYQVQPDPAKLIALGLSFADIAQRHRGQQRQPRRQRHRAQRRRHRRAHRRQARNPSDIGDVVVSTRGRCRCVSATLPKWPIGGEIRTGSASENGREVVVGTALMLIGSNSRTVAAAVDAKIDQVRRTLPAGIEIQTVLNRTQLVERDDRDRRQQPRRGRAAGDRRAVPAARQFPRGTHYRAGDPGGHADDRHRHVAGADQRQPDEPRRAGFRLDRRWRGDHRRKHPAPPGRTAGGDRAASLSLSERLQTVQRAAEEMIGPSVYGQAIIMLVYVPLLTFSGVEGKMFEPMALTVILALAAAFVLSLTFVPALIAIFVTGRVSESDNAIVRRLKAAYAPLLKRTIKRPLPVIAGAVLLFARRLAGVLAARPGVHPDAR